MEAGSSGCCESASGVDLDPRLSAFRVIHQHTPVWYISHHTHRARLPLTPPPGHSTLHDLFLTLSTYPLWSPSLTIIPLSTLLFSLSYLAQSSITSSTLEHGFITLTTKTRLAIFWGRVPCRPWRIRLSIGSSGRGGMVRSCGLM